MTDTWETKASIPKRRNAIDANVVDGKIYVMGGGLGSPTNVTEVYDPSTNTWSTKASMTYRVESYASAVVDNRIFIIGGQGNAVGATQIYDTATDTWSLGAPSPTPIWQTEAAATTGIFAPKKIYVFGELLSDGLDGLNINQVYNPYDDNWTIGAPMPTARYQTSVAVVDDRFYVLGELDIAFTPKPTFYSQNEQYTPFGYGTVPLDTTPPTVTIVSPENKTYTASNVSLTYTVSEPASWVGYSLDSQDSITLSGNTTLADLSNGAHKLAIFANDTAGNMGASETLHFTVAQETQPQPPEPFPTTCVAVTAIALVSLAAIATFYFVRRRK